MYGYISNNRNKFYCKSSFSLQIVSSLTDSSGLSNISNIIVLTTYMHYEQNTHSILYLNVYICIYTIYEVKGIHVLRIGAEG